jgi:hypothetical protein
MQAQVGEEFLLTIREFDVGGAEHTNSVRSNKDLCNSFFSKLDSVWE